MAFTDLWEIRIQCPFEHRSRRRRPQETESPKVRSHPAAGAIAIWNAVNARSPSSPEALRRASLAVGNYRPVVLHRALHRSCGSPRPGPPGRVSQLVEGGGVGPWAHRLLTCT